MASEKNLYDMLVMHQVYLEQVKNAFDYDFRRRIPKLSREIKRVFAELEVSNLGDLTRKELFKFTKTVNRVSAKFFNGYLKEVQRDLKEFLSEDRALEVLILGNELDKDGTEPIEDESEAEKLIKTNKKNESENESENYPLAWLFGSNDPAFFETLMNQPMSATGTNGMSELELLKTVAGTAIVSAINKVWMANGTKQEALDAILGTADNNLKDGLLLKIERNNASVLRTIQQSIAIELEASLQALVYSKYKWVSVMDARTSEICRYLNGRIFEYGKGPLPPRHMRCRSKIAPLASGVPTSPETFLQWLQRQSRQDQTSLVGTKKADMIRDGKVKNVDFSKIESTLRLKPSELRSKILKLTR